jgi:hypothetical protein
MCFLDSLEPLPLEPQPGLEEPLEPQPGLEEPLVPIIKNYNDQKVQSMLRRLKDSLEIQNEVSVLSNC